MSKIDFTKSQTADPVSVFETTIRYMGGLLSAYELSGQQFPALQKKAQDVGDLLSKAWPLVRGFSINFLSRLTFVSLG